MTSIEELLEMYQGARRLFAEGAFTDAEREVIRYKELVDYGKMMYEDHRVHANCLVSVVIVSYNQGAELLNCLDSLRFPNEIQFEVILVDNGKNESIHPELRTRQLLHFLSPINFTPSEGRNIGAHFATGKILVFLDDDCTVGENFFESILLAFNTFDLLAIRGRVLAKSPGGNTSAPQHYDLGGYPIPAPLVTEGNMAVSREAYMSVGGMHPLMFGLEGVELTWRLLKKFPEKDIYYWPGMVIHHDHISWDGRIAKKKRHAVAKEYLRNTMGKQADLTAQFNRWYEDRPGPFKRYESRSATVRLRHAFLDALAAFLYGRKR